MNIDFIASTMKEATYTLKADTKGSYYWASGSRILPDRLSISKESQLTAVARKGRNLQHPIAGQMVGSYKKDEESPLKVNKPYVCRTQIWQVEEYPLFIGYGTTGISGEDGKIHDTGDLIVFFTPDNWQSIRVFFFTGMGSPEHLLECMEFCNTKVRE